MGMQLSELNHIVNDPELIKKYQTPEIIEGIAKTGEASALAAVQGNEVADDDIYTDFDITTEDGSSLPVTVGVVKCIPDLQYGEGMLPSQFSTNFLRGFTASLQQNYVQVIRKAIVEVLTDLSTGSEFALVDEDKKSIASKLQSSMFNDLRMEYLGVEIHPSDRNGTFYSATAGLYIVIPGRDKPVASMNDSYTSLITDIADGDKRLQYLHHQFLGCNIHDVVFWYVIKYGLSLDYDNYWKLKEEVIHKLTAANKEDFDAIWPTI